MIPHLTGQTLRSTAHSWKCVGPVSPWKADPCTDLRSTSESLLHWPARRPSSRRSAWCPALRSCLRLPGNRPSRSGPDSSATSPHRWPRRTPGITGSSPATSTAPGAPSTPLPPGTPQRLPRIRMNRRRATRIAQQQLRAVLNQLIHHGLLRTEVV